MDSKTDHCLSFENKINLIYYYYRECYSFVDFPNFTFCDSIQKS